MDWQPLVGSHNWQPLIGPSGTLFCIFEYVTRGLFNSYFQMPNLLKKD